MSGEFCVKCAEKEAQMEIVRMKYHEHVKELEQRLEKLEVENDKLSLDLAFYSGTVINLSCDNR